jgi:hypothetical protein
MHMILQMHFQASGAAAALAGTSPAGQPQARAPHLS